MNYSEAFITPKELNESFTHILPIINYGNKYSKVLTRNKESNTGGYLSGNIIKSCIPIWVKYRKFIGENIKQLYEGEYTAIEMWYTEYLHKSYISLHNHIEANIVSVGYLNVDEQDKSSCLVVQNNEDYSLVDIPVSNGDVLIFDGNLMHKSKPNMSNTLRKLVAINYKIIMPNSPV